jgi:hypothetical protein
MRGDLENFKIKKIKKIKIEITYNNVNFNIMLKKFMTSLGVWIEVPRNFLEAWA